MKVWIGILFLALSALRAFGDDFPRADLPPADWFVRQGFEIRIKGLTGKADSEALETLRRVLSAPRTSQLASPRFDCRVELEQILLWERDARPEEVDITRITGNLVCFRHGRVEAELQEQMRQALTGPLSKAAGVPLALAEVPAAGGVARAFNGYRKNSETPGNQLFSVYGIQTYARSLNFHYPELQCEARIHSLRSGNPGEASVEGSLHCSSKELSPRALYHWMNDLIEYDIARPTGFSLFADKGPVHGPEGGATGSNGVR